MKQRRQHRSARNASPPPQRVLASGDAVGAKLRTMFETLQAAPVPLELTRLIQELEKRRRGRSPRTN